MVSVSPLMVVHDVPAATIASSTSEAPQVVDLANLAEVCESIERHDEALQSAATLDDVRAAVRSLASSTAALAWEVRNLVTGIRAGSVSVVPED